MKVADETDFEEKDEERVSATRHDGDELVFSVEAREI